MNSFTIEYNSSVDKVEATLEEKYGCDHDTTESLQMESPPPLPLKQQERHEDCVSSEHDHKEERADGDTKEEEVAVKFGSIHIREYERVIDSTSIYMGLALGWDFNQSAPQPVTDPDCPSKNHSKSAAQHGGDESRMKRTNGSDRYGMLLRYGYQQKELRRATDEAAKFFKQRQREAARSLVVADERKKAEGDKKKRKPLFGSMFRR